MCDGECENDPHPTPSLPHAGPYSQTDRKQTQIHAEKNSIHRIDAVNTSGWRIGDRAGSHCVLFPQKHKLFLLSIPSLTRTTPMLQYMTQICTLYY